MIADLNHVHCVGIGGSGVGALAELLRRMGCAVSGSDLVEPQDAARLESLGIRWYRGHRAEHVGPQVNCVVHSPAIPEENVELLEARRRGIPVYSLPQMLGRLMASRYGVAVAGTHGKTTTVAMLGRVLEAAGLDPVVVAGAALLDWNSPVRAGRGRVMVVEACEYGRSFLELCPSVAAVLNIEPDHLDWYGTVDGLSAAFAEFVERLPRGGYLLGSADDPGAREVVVRAGVAWELFGMAAQAHWRYEYCSQQEGRYEFRLFYRGRYHCRVKLKVPGAHNVPNAVAALALAHRLGVPTRVAVQALSDFSSCARRLQFVGFRRGVAFYDDYAHHPTEVAASLAALRERSPRSRLWCVFQPHQVWRTRMLADGFARALAAADHVLVLPVYAARERVPVELCRAVAEDLTRRCRAAGGDARYVHGFVEAARCIESLTAAGDTVVTMGAGDVWKVRDVLCEGFPGYREAG